MPRYQGIVRKLLGTPENEPLARPIMLYTYRKSVRKLEVSKIRSLFWRFVNFLNLLIHYCLKKYLILSFKEAKFVFLFLNSVAKQCDWQITQPLAFACS